MFSGDWNLIVLHQENLKDARRRSVRNRLVRDALVGRRGAVRVYAPVLARLGAGLVAWGTDLQTRYGQTPDITPRPWALERKL